MEQNRVYHAVMTIDHVMYNVLRNSCCTGMNDDHLRKLTK